MQGVVFDLHTSDRSMFTERSMAALMLRDWLRDRTREIRGSADLQSKVSANVFGHADDVPTGRLTGCQEINLTPRLVNKGIVRRRQSLSGTS